MGKVFVLSAISLVCEAVRQNLGHIVLLDLYLENAFLHENAALCL